jgi:asparagine synthase (glutamine-hydrolysing)
VGAHIAYDGNGGDQLFQVSPAFLADLLRAGRWLTFVRESRALGLGGFRDFFRWGVKPWLSPRVLDAATMVRRGRRIHGLYERRLPPWTHQRIADTIRSRQRLHVPPRAGRSCWAYEANFYLSSTFLPRAFGASAGTTLEQGVELRSPLYDQRIIEFAARRPRQERCSEGETKRLLRRAMRDLLPEHVLAPRPFRTGVSSAYFARETRGRFPSLFDAAGDSWTLADLGILEPRALARARDLYLTNLDSEMGLALLCTLQAELWVRAQLHSADLPSDAVDGDAGLASSRAGGRSWEAHA